MDKENMDVAETILFMAGYADAVSGVSPESPESSVAAYYAGRKEAKRSTESLVKTILEIFQANNVDRGETPNFI